MSLIVNTHVGSLNAQRSLAASGAELKTAMERLSSGKKINSAADDAAGFAIAERMTAQIRGLNMATKNANDGLSLLAVIENATNDVTDMLHRMRELAVQAVNDTNSLEDRKFLQKEADALLAEINRVATETLYNGQDLLDGSLQNKSIQVGTEAGQTVTFSVGGIDTHSLMLEGTHTILTNTGKVIDWHGGDYVGSNDGFFDGQIEAGDIVAFESNLDDHYTVQRLSDGGGTILNEIFISPHIEYAGQPYKDDEIFEVETTTAAIDIVNDASGALASISSAIDQVSGQRATLGALQNRLEYTISNLMNVAEFTTAARSRIEDADFAIESARLAKAQVLQQAGTAMLAQANAQPQLALSLIS